MYKGTQIIQINVPVEEVRVRLEEMLDSPHRNMVADVIIGYLDKSPGGLEALVKALHGYQFFPKYKEGDEVLVDPTYLSSWRIDKDKMKEKGLLMKEGVRCKIESVDWYHTFPYRVSYNWINDKDETGEDKYSVREENMFQEEYPEDIYKWNGPVPGSKVNLVRKSANFKPF